MEGSTLGKKSGNGHREPALLTEALCLVVLDFEERGSALAKGKQSFANKQPRRWMCFEGKCKNAVQV